MIVDLRSLPRTKETSAIREMLTDSARPIATESLRVGVLLVIPWVPGTDPHHALQEARRATGVTA